MLRLIPLLLLTAWLAGCAATPTPPAMETPRDPMSRLLEPGETVTYRVRAQLWHGHDMEEPAYDQPEGYRQVPGYSGELAITDRRLLFLALPAGERPGWLSIPIDGIARARPSQTQLLHYAVIWDGEGRPNSFVVDRRDVREFHQQIGRILVRRSPGRSPAAGH